ncbi:MAG TPA: hypothetical protein VNA19_03575 [Pyrinomonadaceae bacterium]|jgi:hypothetical protein|nr:hypothetical protein [Pyrinomonadaceae bacterium]
MSCYVEVSSSPLEYYGEVSTWVLYAFRLDLIRFKPKKFEGYGDPFQH